MLTVLGDIIGIWQAENQLRKHFRVVPVKCAPSLDQEY